VTTPKASSTSATWTTPRASRHFYFAESELTFPSCSSPRHFLAAAQLRVEIGNQTLLLRAYRSTRLRSSRPVTFGTPATAVTGGGTAPGSVAASQEAALLQAPQDGSGFGRLRRASLVPSYCDRKSLNKRTQKHHRGTTERKAIRSSRYSLMVFYVFSVPSGENRSVRIREYGNVNPQRCV